MYKINPPKIHLSTVIGYDAKKKTYLIKDEQIFDTEKDLICFLAEHHYPVCNWDGKPIRDRYKNRYLDNQALNGISRRGQDNSIYDEVMHALYPSRTSNIYYKCISSEWKLNKFLFWLESPGKPNFDVRTLREKVNAEYLRQSTIKTDWRYYYRLKAEKKHKERQGRNHHKCYPWRDDSRYIQRARTAYGMEAEEEYKRFVKAKDKAFKSIWSDEDFGGYHSTGWKDNSGNRYRHQWEAKERRNYEKIKRNKGITMFSGKKGESKKARRTKEELEAEVEMLREEFGC